MIVAVTSWRGVGTTTTALALAAVLAEAQPAWLVEADHAGGVLAGRLDLAVHELGGLERVAFGTEAADPHMAFAAVAHQLDRVRVVAAPADPFRAHACHSPRVPWHRLVRELDADVVLDVGRVRPGAGPWAALSTADVVVVVTSPEVASAVATVEWCRAGGAVLAGEPGFGKAPVLVASVAAPTGVAFDAAALRAELGSAWGAWLAWEPATVDLLLRGASPEDRRLRRSALIAGAHHLADAVRRTAVHPTTEAA